MAHTGSSIRASLKHPVIDGDGHLIEFLPLLAEYVQDTAGPEVAKRWRAQNLDAKAGYTQGAKANDWYGQSAEQRRERRTMRPPFWAWPTENTTDLATAVIPGVLAERMAAIGIDYSILYPTLGLSMLKDGNSEMRQVSCRALNRMLRDQFAPYADRMTPAAAIPVHTPQEAIAELDYCVNELGLKVAAISGHVRRPVEQSRREAPAATQHATWIDHLALDSEFDYDPLWRRCVELKVSPTIHSGSMGWGSRTSISSYNFNHIGHFAAANEASAKALFFGGVTRRFPTLRFGFLEGGAGWAANLYADIVGHWDKRNRAALERLDPARLDPELFQSLAAKHAHGRLAESIARNGSDRSWLERSVEDRAALDEWAACEIGKREDIRELFAARFYLGCEADDPSVAVAFNQRLNPMRTALKPMFSSDIGHWDVPDVNDVLCEAYELVEKELISESQFRAFTFENIVELHAGANPEFFKGTRVEAQCAQARKAA